MTSPSPANSPRLAELRKAAETRTLTPEEVREFVALSRKSFLSLPSKPVKNAKAKAAPAITDEEPDFF